MKTNHVFDGINKPLNQLNLQLAQSWNFLLYKSFKVRVSIISVNNIIEAALLLVSYTYCNHLPKNWWLNITDTYSLTALEVRSPKWKCQQGWFLIGSSDGPCLSLAAAGCSQSSAFSDIEVSLQSLPLFHMAFSSVCWCLVSSYDDTSHIG